MTGAVVPAPVAVHFKFGGEAAHATVSVPPPATPEAVCAAVLKARKDVAAMLKDAYAGFELAVCDAASGRRSSRTPRRSRRTRRWRWC